MPNRPLIRVNRPKNVTTFNISEVASHHWIGRIAWVSEGFATQAYHQARTFAEEALGTLAGKAAKWPKRWSRAKAR